MVGLKRHGGKAISIQLSVKMRFMAMDIFSLTCGLILGLILSHVFNPLFRGRALHSKFAALGDLEGKSKSQIIAAVGPPNAASPLGDGTTFLQWLATGYHLGLIFEGEICRKVQHEVSFLKARK